MADIRLAFDPPSTYVRISALTSRIGLDAKARARWMVAERRKVS